MLPTQEGFHAGDLGASQGIHRLVEELELIAFDGLPEVVFQLQAIEGVGVLAPVEDLVAGLRLALRPVQGYVRGPHEEVSLPPAHGVAQGDADADRGEYEVALDCERRPQLPDNPLGDLLSFAHARDVFQQKGKLVAPQPRSDFPLPQTRLDTPTHRGEEMISHLVAQRVVHYLEIIQVHKQYRALAPVSPARALEGPL